MEHLFLGVGKADMLSLCTGKDGIRAVGHIGSHGVLVQQVKDTVGTGEHLGQAGTEVGQRHHRPKELRADRVQTSTPSAPSWPF